MAWEPSEKISLERGAFQFPIPFHWRGWLGWGVGGALTLVGLAAWTPFLAAVGLALLAGFTPTSLAADIYRLRREARPEAVAEQEREGGVDRDWWMGRTTITPSSDNRDWILPAPGPASWNPKDIYGPDEGGEPLPEHPAKVGVPAPAMVTSYTLFAGLACLAYLAWATVENDIQMLVFGLLLAGVLLGFGYWLHRRVQLLRDTPTSLVRSLAVGPVELVGQVRTAPEGDRQVKVDGSRERTLDHMVGWRWTYEVLRRNRSGGGKKEQFRWETVREKEQAFPFVLHDGTGGVRVDAATFGRFEYGNYLRRWEVRHDPRTMSQGLMSHGLLKGLMNRLTETDIKRHRWTLWGLRVGNPVYLLGIAASRPQKELRKEGIDTSLQNALLTVKSEDAPGFKARIDRGTDLANMGVVRSSFELLVLPALMLVATLVATLVAFGA